MTAGISHESLLAAAVAEAKNGGDATVAQRRLATFSPAFSGVYLSLGGQASRSGNPRSGTKLLGRALCAGPQDARIHFQAADAAYRRAAFREAQRHARAALLLAPGTANAHRLLASAAFQNRNHETAARVLGWSRHIVAPASQDLLIWMWTLFELDRLAACIHVARCFVATSAASPLGYSLLSRALARQDHTEEARRQVRRLQVLAPRDPEVLAGLGRLLVSQRRYAPSVQLFRKALLMDPSRDAGWFDLARAYWAMEAFEESEDTLARACLIAPGLAVRAEVLRLSATSRDFRLPSVVRETA